MPARTEELLELNDWKLPLVPLADEPVGESSWLPRMTVAALFVLALGIALFQRYELKDAEEQVRLQRVALQAIRSSSASQKDVTMARMETKLQDAADKTAECERTRKETRMKLAVAERGAYDIRKLEKQLKSLKRENRNLKSLERKYRNIPKRSRVAAETEPGTSVCEAGTIEMSFTPEDSALCGEPTDSAYVDASGLWQWIVIRKDNKKRVTCSCQPSGQ